MVWPVRVSPGLLQLVDLSLQLANRSGGLFDPTVLRDLEAAAALLQEVRQQDRRLVMLLRRLR